MGKRGVLQRSRHAVFLLHVHLVFVAKYRGKVFDDDAHERLRKYFRISRVGQQAALVFLPAGMVYAESTIVFPFSD